MSSRVFPKALRFAFLWHYSSKNTKYGYSHGRTYHFLAIKLHCSMEISQFKLIKTIRMRRQAINETDRTHTLQVDPIGAKIIVLIRPIPRRSRLCRKTLTLE